MNYPDHMLAYFDGETAVCETEAEAIKAVEDGALFVARVCPSDGSWRDITAELAEDWWFANASDKWDAIPEGFDQYIPQSEVNRFER